MAKNSSTEKEMEKLEKQFQTFDENIKSQTFDRMNEAPKEESEPQAKLSSKQIENSKDIYLKPKSTIFSRDKFNEKFRDAYNFSKEYVQFIAQHNEMPGNIIEGIWTRPFAGVPAEQWDIPTGVPVWGPRYLAEQITKSQYHRFKMDQTVGNGSDNRGNLYYGSMAVDTIVQRLDAIPVSSRKSIFMGKAA